MQTTASLKELAAAVTDGRDYQYVKADYILRLSSKGLTGQKIGDLIGMSQGAVDNIIREGQCRKCVDLAAKAVYLEKYKEPEKQKQAAAIIKGEMAHLKTIQDLISTLGGNFVFIGDM